LQTSLKIGLQFFRKKKEKHKKILKIPGFTFLPKIAKILQKRKGAEI